MIKANSYQTRMAIALGSLLIEGCSDPCGPQTVEVDGQCVVDSNIGACSAGTILRGDSCVDAELQRVSLPFPAGFEVEIGQGYDGYLSHYDTSRYAVDFPVPEGTSVVAARSGLVWHIKEDSDISCDTEECINDGNYVIIDHGDGTFAAYYHLQKDGALVAPGEKVCKGQPIGLSGNTGFSTGPHLHFDITDPFGHTLPLVFEELESTTGGTPVSLSAFTSANELASCDEELKNSTCPPDLFEHRGILLDSEVPCAVASFSDVYTVAGKVLVPGSTVTVSIYLASVDDWEDKCVPADEDGSFSATLQWSKAQSPEYSHLMITASDEACDYAGWHTSATVLLR
jgi:hypothetical protein